MLERLVSRVDALEPSDVIPLLGLPCLNKRISAGNALNESLWPHRSSEFERSEIVFEIEKPSPVFEPGNVFADKHCAFFNFGLSKSHATPSPKLPDTSEQLPIGAYLGAAVQRINAFTKVLIDEPAFCNGTVPANDNFPPSEAEAA